MLWWLPNDVQYILPWPLSGVVVCLCVRTSFPLPCVCVFVSPHKKKKKKKMYNIFYSNTLQRLCIKIINLEFKVSHYLISRVFHK